MGALIWVYRPSRYYFFKDAWDMLYGFLESPWSILRPHKVLAGTRETIVPADSPQ